MLRREGSVEYVKMKQIRKAHTNSRCYRHTNIDPLSALSYTCQCD